MSLARAFTKRIKRHNDEGSVSPPAKISTVRYAPGTINRNNISLPTELLSTTNVQALTAPDIPRIPDTASSSSSTHSDHDSDFSTVDRSFLSNDSTPPTPVTPPTDNEKGFFEAPIIPRRAPSHSKKAHMDLSRKMSEQRMSPPPVSLARARSTRELSTLSVTNTDENHPFGRELAQVNEVAEGFNSGVGCVDEEELLMQEQGLMKFGVEDYINEIQQLYGGVFEDHLGRTANPWL